MANKFEQPNQETKEEPLIKVVSPVGAEGRKISEKTIDNAQRTIDELKFEKDIKKKQKEGVLLSKEETAKLRELEKEAEKHEDLEKKKELILDDVRKEYAKIDLNAEKYIKENKGKLKNDFEGYEEAKSAYLEALKNQRVKMYEKALKEVKGLSLPESKKEEKNKKMKEKMEEIVKETIIKEANKLYDQKMDLKLEAKGELGKLEKIKNFTGKIVEKYRRMPLYKKLLISGGLIAGGIAAGAAGGATAAALATGMVTGRWAQRALGGAATAVGLEALIKRSQEKKEGKEVLAELANELQKSIKDNDKKLDKKLFELEGSKKGQKTRRYIIAGAAGTLVGSGLVGKALNGVVGGIWGGEGAEKVTEKVVEQVQTEGFTETAGKGDSVWKMAEDQLEKYYGGKFSGLDKATQTHLIDAVKDKVAENSEKFGLEDVDKLKVGQKVDFSSIFEDSAQMDEMSKEASSLVDSEKTNILNNNNKIEEWMSEHPKEELTSEKVDEILSGKTEISDTEVDVAAAENKLVESLGFTPDEYSAIESVKVDYLLEQLPSKFEAWEMWHNTPTNIDLPHDGIYGFGEFGRHIELAEYIRSLNPNEGAKQMTISQFMRVAASK